MQIVDGYRCTNSEFNQRSRIQNTNSNMFDLEATNPKHIGGTSIGKPQDPYPIEESKPIGGILQSHLVSSNTIKRSFHSKQVSTNNNKSQFDRIFCLKGNL